MADESKPKPEARAAKPQAKTEQERPEPLDHPVYKRLKELRPEVLAAGSHVHMGDLHVFVAREKLAEAMELLRDHPDFRCDYLVSLTAVDWPERPKRFDMVYTLHSIPLNHRFNVVVELGEDEEVASVAGLWKTADWQERECFDMFGVRFTGHPDLRRILLPEWWEGFPLRKDYPVSGRGEHERVVEESLRPPDAD